MVSARHAEARPDTGRAGSASQNQRAGSTQSGSR